MREVMTVRIKTACSVSLAAVLATVMGCADRVVVERVHPAVTLRAQLNTRLTSNALSAQTQTALWMLDLERTYSVDPDRVIRDLATLAETEPDARWRIAAAELLLDQAERANGADLSLYLACAEEADREIRRATAQQGGLLDARTEFASDLYHRAVSRYVELAGKDRLHRDETRWKGRGGAFTVRIEPPAAEAPAAWQSVDRSRWRVTYFDQLVPTDALRVFGMETHHRIDAYGAPVVAIRNQDDAQPPRQEAHIPPEGAIYPATAVLRFAGKGRCVLELWNTDVVSSISRHGVELRLSTDTTAPIATLFARTQLALDGQRGLFNVEQYLRRAGIYLHEPFDPQKIPVLLIHGLRSSPMTWRGMLNDLRSEPELRRRFQFWMFYYPTGLPIPRSAALLRAELSRLWAQLDPERTSSGRRQMVLIGHSMGGLLAKAICQRSESTLWNSLHPDPFDAIDAPAEVRAHLEAVFFYEANPDVTRAIFIASPHAGSPLASSLGGRLGDALIELPDEFDPIDRWFEQERRQRSIGLEYQLGRGVPSSIDDLQPDSPHLRAYQHMPIDPRVTYHVIYGNVGDGSDGVVPVESARFRGAASERGVDADHSVHTHPLAIREVRRILKTHLRENGE